jgi:hypothetical protein
MSQKKQNNYGITAGEKYIKNEKCSYCGKGGKLKWYIIADDLENPKPYHKKCIWEIFIRSELKIKRENEMQNLS